MLGRKRKEADVFDEPDFEEQASRIPTEEQKQNNKQRRFSTVNKFRYAAGRFY